MVISQLSGIQHLLYSSIDSKPIPEISPDSSEEEYKQHLCEIICMVFRAEDTINKADPELHVKLKSKQISPNQYVEKIADEILAHTPEDFIP